MRVIHDWTADSATIETEGVERAIRVLHVTDSHLTLIDERDAATIDACQPQRDRFDTMRRDDAGRTPPR